MVSSCCMVFMYHHIAKWCVFRIQCAFNPSHQQLFTVGHVLTSSGETTKVCACTHSIIVCVYDYQCCHQLNPVLLYMHKGTICVSTCILVDSNISLLCDHAKIPYSSKNIFLNCNQRKKSNFIIFPFI